MSVSDASPVSIRLPAGLLAALRKRADENGETVSDVIRNAAFMLLGYCPTCGQKTPQAAGHIEGT